MKVKARHGRHAEAEAWGLRAGMEGMQKLQHGQAKLPSASCCAPRQITLLIVEGVSLQSIERNPHNQC